MMAPNRPDQPKLGEVARFIAVDWTTTTAALKTLERRGWVQNVVDAQGARARRLTLNDAGLDVLVAAVPAWRAEHDRVDAMLAAGLDGLETSRPGLVTLAYGPPPTAK